METANILSCDREMSCQIKEVKRLSRVSLISNIILSGLKLLAGTIGASQAVVADGVHSLTDTATDLAVLVGVDYWSAPPDQTHQHGHHRIETLITAFIGIVLGLMALGVGYNALKTIMVEENGSPGLIALIAALVSIVSKEMLYRWNVNAGKRINSPAIIANAWHHRSDGLSSIPVALAVAGARFLPGWYLLDRVGAVLVSVFILQAAWKIAWPTIQELTDSAASFEICQQIEEISLATEGVLQIHKCRTRHLGPGIQVDLHVLVNPNYTVRKGHRISQAVKHRLLKEVPNVIDAIIHLEPLEENDDSL